MAGHHFDGLRSTKRKKDKKFMRHSRFDWDAYRDALSSPDDMTKTTPATIARRPNGFIMDVSPDIGLHFADAPCAPCWKSCAVRRAIEYLILRGTQNAQL